MRTRCFPDVPHVGADPAFAHTAPLIFSVVVPVALSAITLTAQTVAEAAVNVRVTVPDVLMHIVSDELTVIV